MVSDYHLRAAWRAFDRQIYKGMATTWNDVEYSYTRHSCYPLLKTGLDFVDEEWMKYWRE